MALPRPLSWCARTLLLGAILASLPAVLHAQAQATTGVIRGTVTDSTGQPLSGATVTLRNRETNAQRTLNTNASGSLSSLPIT